MFALAHLDHEAHAAIQILIVWRGLWFGFPLVELRVLADDDVNIFLRGLGIRCSFFDVGALGNRY